MVRLPHDDMDGSDGDAERLARAMLIDDSDEFEPSDTTTPDGWKAFDDFLHRYFSDEFFLDDPAPDWGHGEESAVYRFPASERGRSCCFVEEWPLDFLDRQLAAGVDVRPYFLSADFGPVWWTVDGLRKKLWTLMRSSEKSAGRPAGCLFGVVGLYSVAVLLPDEQVGAQVLNLHQGAGVVHRLSMLLFSVGELDEAKVVGEWCQGKGRSLVLRPIPVEGDVRPWVPADGAGAARSGLELAIRRVIARGVNAAGTVVRVFPFNEEFAEVFHHGDLKAVMGVSEAVS